MGHYYEDKKIIEVIEKLYKSPWAQGLDKEGTLMNFYHDGIKDALKILIAIIRGDAPDSLKIEAADVTAANVGEWKKGNDCYWYCSECGSRHTRTEMVYSKDCPYCGARLNAKGDA